MSELEQPVVAFMLELQRMVNEADAAAIAGAFALSLLEATPAGVSSRDNDDAFRSAIEQRLALLRAAGIHDVKALQIDPTPLNPSYALVRVRWSVWFTPAGRPDFVDEFLVDYVVRLTEDRFEIVASIAHDEEADVRRRIGLTG